MTTKPNPKAHQHLNPRQSFALQHPCARALTIVDEHFEGYKLVLRFRGVLLSTMLTINK